MEEEIKASFNALYALKLHRALHHDDDTPKTPDELAQDLPQGWFQNFVSEHSHRMAKALNEHRTMKQSIEFHGSDAGRERVRNQIQQEKWALEQDCDYRQVVATQSPAHAVMRPRSGKRRTRAHGAATKSGDDGDGAEPELGPAVADPELQSGFRRLQLLRELPAAPSLIPARRLHVFVD